QFLDDLNRWTLLLISPFTCPEKFLLAEHPPFVAQSISANTENLQKVPDFSKETVKWSDYCSPLAYKPGEPFQVVAQVRVDHFSSLGRAFLEDRLQMENGMVPQRIVCKYFIIISCMAKPTGQGGEEQCKLEEDEDEPSSVSDQEAGAGEHHHLHLSSCHECLQLENSTIESVRFASAENIAELPGGGSSSSSLEGEQDGPLVEGMKRVNLAGKPPNVLIYLGSETAPGKLEQVRSVLRECVDAESYTIYQLQQEQVLRDPWVDNSLLLVIATEEPIPQGHHRQFIKFLSKGGKILGLSSSFTCGGVRLKRRDELRRTVQEVVFSRGDNPEVKLNLLVSGCVFEEAKKEDSGEVRTLCRLSEAENDAVVVRVAVGGGGGEAVLSQAHLELDGNSMDVQTEEEFNLLKTSNARRFEVLQDLLGSLGLSCEHREVPVLSPVHLLCPDEETHLAFLKWLEGNVDAEGLRASSKVSLKFVSSCDPGVEVTPSLMPVVTEMGSFSSEHFSLKTYQQNLQTKKLGKILLFAEVTTTTMNLLDG
ncbi:BPL1 ligase, partial [Formicarius rufipectus]|nr:BPL1 ligase [Formicarius rufipectus]